MIRPTHKPLSSLLALAIAGFSLPSALIAGEPVPPSGDPVNKSASKAGLIAIQPNGQVIEATWAQAKLNHGGNSSNELHSFVYPETFTSVRLYLIDSSVANPGNWFDGNGNLTLTSPVLLGTTSPGKSRSSTHATQMLGLIAGPETGAALGTDIEVVNYDIYPDGEANDGTSGLLIEAIERATDHYENPSNSQMPSVICIAAGSADPAESDDLEDAILDAVDAGITVVVSAGNHADDASLYVPSQYGSFDGVVCVGASNKSNGLWFDSNSGSAVDLYAPGENVPTLSLPVPASEETSLMFGTSPATALATATALAKLSMNPKLTPSELEDQLKNSGYDAGSGLLLVQLPPTDSDGDGAHDLLEIFSGSDPLSASEMPDRTSVAGSTSADGTTSVSITFSIDASLFESETPFELKDGITWQVVESTNHVDWDESTIGSFAFDSVGDKIQVTYTRISTEACCFLKLAISPAE